MSNGRDGFENGNSGGIFVIGLVAGTVLGAGLGMLFAPKSGSELRGQLSDQAGSLATTAMKTASETYERATDVAGEWVAKNVKNVQELTRS
jgi:gas vesicle protein